jgi:3-hydroxyisobutyrate dehydrogenase-like beta-hydroxyacid dehydrogenase
MGPESAQMKLGFIGLGRMGSGMAGQLLRAGFAVQVFDPDLRQSARLVEQGASVASDLGALARSVDVLISMLPSDEALLEAATASGGLVEHLSPKAIHMVCGTHSVAAVAQLITAHQVAGQHLVACPVLGRPDLAATGKLGLVPGGALELTTALQPVLAALGDRIFPAGADPLAATAMKIANNFVLGCAIEAMGEGMAMVRKYAVDPVVFHQVLVGGLFNCTAYQAYGDLIAKQDWGRVGASAVIGLKDANLAIDAAAAVAIRLPSAEIWQQGLQAAIARGESQLDWSVMAREQFRAAGLEQD